MTDAPNTIDRIHEDLRELAVPIDELNEDPANANSHNDASLAGIAASFIRFGQRKPIVVRREGMVIEAGNGTLAALKAAGWTHLACVKCDDDEVTAKAFALADNNRRSTWDMNQLAQNVGELLEANYDLTGLWSDDELKVLADRTWVQPSIGIVATEDEDQPAPDSEPADTVAELQAKPADEPEDFIPEPPAEPVTKFGDVIELGPHTLHCADCMDVLAGMPDDSVDSIVCDPPYGLSPDGRARTWDDIAALRAAGKKGPTAGFMGSAWDAGVPGITWARECLRVLKPGGHIVAFSATRTVHRLACAIEDAGFEIRDQYCHLQYAGFPKSKNMGLAIDEMMGCEREVTGTRSVAVDKWTAAGRAATAAGQVSAYTVDNTKPSSTLAGQWEGFGTSLKPAIEPAVIARKPLDKIAPEEVADLLGQDHYWASKAAIPAAPESGDTKDMTAKRKASAELWGEVPAGAVVWRARPLRAAVQGRIELRVSGEVVATREGAKYSKAPLQTVALNVLKWGTGAYNIDACRHPFGDKAWPGPNRSQAEIERTAGPNIRKTGGTAPDQRIYGAYDYATGPATHDLGRFPANVYHCPKPARRERDAGCADLEAVETMRYSEQGQGPLAQQTPRKPSSQHNHHSTVKPLKVIRQLAKLVTPPGGTIFESFGGSGTILPAVRGLGFRVTLAEREPKYMDIVRARGEHSLRPIEPPPRRVPARPGGKPQARRRIQTLHESGAIPAPGDLPCHDCGDTTCKSPHEYDHYLGYGEDKPDDQEHVAMCHETVQAVCASCHHKREAARVAVS